MHSPNPLALELLLLIPVKVPLICDDRDVSVHMEVRKLRYIGRRRRDVPTATVLPALAPAPAPMTAQRSIAQGSASEPAQGSGGGSEGGGTGSV